MPRSEDLYSAHDGADDESNGSELGPTDGYFTRSEISQSRMATDPMIEDGKPERIEGKVLIPTPTTQSSAGKSVRTSLNSLLPGPSRQSYYASAQPVEPNRNISRPSTSDALSNPASFRRQTNMYSGDTSFEGPPPAYYPNPTSSTAIFSPPISDHEGILPVTERENTLRDRALGIFNYLSDHIRERERSFFFGGEPESMSRPEDEISERTPLTRPPPRAWARRRAIRKSIFLAVVVAIFFSTFTTIMHLRKSRSGSHEGHNVPGTPPPPGSFCHSASFKHDEVQLELPTSPTGSDINVIQTVYSNEGSGWKKSVKTSGEVRLRRLDPKSGHGNQGYFTVNVQVSDPGLNIITTWDSEQQVLRVSTPSHAQLSSDNFHCISIEIDAWIPEGANFTDISIQAVSLHLRVMDGVRVNVLGSSKFETVSGTVTFPSEGCPQTLDMDTPMNQEIQPNTELSISSSQLPFSSRRITVETISGSINGCYPLMDFLGVSSQTGSITISISPEAVDASAPAPAELNIHTSSGTIKASLPIPDILQPNYTPPARDYITSVQTVSATIDGSFYIGRSSKFKSHSGTIRLTGLPILQSITSTTKEDQANIFETNTISGTTNIHLLDPIFISLSTHSIIKNSSKEKLRTLRSVHTTTSATQNLKYPSVWEGNLHAKSLSGGIHVRGEGLQIVKDGDFFGGKGVLARKGVYGEEEGSWVEMKSVSGTLGFVVGEN